MYKIRTIKPVFHLSYIHAKKFWSPKIIVKVEGTR